MGLEHVGEGLERGKVQKHAGFESGAHGSEGGREIAPALFIGKIEDGREGVVHKVDLGPCLLQLKSGGDGAQAHMVRAVDHQTHSLVFGHIDAPGAAPSSRAVVM